MSNSQNLLDFANRKVTIVIKMFLCFMKKFIMRIAWQTADQGICTLPDLSWPLCLSVIPWLLEYRKKSAPLDVNSLKAWWWECVLRFKFTLNRYKVNFKCVAWKESPEKLSQKQLGWIGYGIFQMGINHNTMCGALQKGLPTRMTWERLFQDFHQQLWISVPHSSLRLLIAPYIISFSTCSISFPL